RLPVDHTAEAVVIMNVEMLQRLQGNPFPAADIAENAAQAASRLYRQGSRIGEGMVALLAIELQPVKGYRALGEKVAVSNDDTVDRSQHDSAVLAGYRCAAAGQTDRQPPKRHKVDQGAYKSAGGAQNHRPDPQ